MQLKLSTLISLAFATAITSKGINCKGSFMCTLSVIGNRWVAELLSDAIDTVPDDYKFENRQKIACIITPNDLLWTSDTNAICAFLEHSDGADAKTVKHAAKELVKKGCRKCGATALMYPKNNNTEPFGNLKFDYVYAGCENNGLCPDVLEAIAKEQTRLKHKLLETENKRLDRENLEKHEIARPSFRTTTTSATQKNAHQTIY